MTTGPAIAASSSRDALNGPSRSPFVKRSFELLTNRNRSRTMGTMGDRAAKDALFDAFAEVATFEPYGLDDRLGHASRTRRRHANHRGARHARLLRRVSSPTAARAHLPPGRIRRRGVNHVAAGVQRGTGDRLEPSPVADPGRRSSGGGPDRLRGRPRLAGDWRDARGLRRARCGRRLLGAMGHAGVVPPALSEWTAARCPVLAGRRPDEGRAVNRRRRGEDAGAGRRIGGRASGHQCRMDGPALSARR